MHPNSFARALRFLNYFPFSKWLALFAGVGTGILFVALLLVLALFTDLIVNRGEIPCLHNLPIRERNAWRESAAFPEDAEANKARIDHILQGLKELGVEDPKVAHLLVHGPAKPSAPETEFRWHLLWFVDLPELVRDSVGEDAAQMVRERVRAHIMDFGLEAAVQRNLTDLGILSLVVRTRSSSQSWPAMILARWNDWMWEHGNSAYLQGLFLVALGLGLARFVLAFLASTMAARATLGAVTRLRKTIYQQTYRLGTLAFRALGPSEAVGVSTRHLESVHAGLYAWLTVYFREPVKFGLLLVFAMVVNFWLALAFLLFALLVWLVGGQIAAWFRHRGRTADMRAADQLALIQESLMMMRLVKVYLMEKFNLARFENQVAAHAQAQFARYRGEAFYRPLFTLLGLLAALILLLVAGFVILHGYLGVASSMVMVTALVSLYWPLVAWLENRRLLRRARQSAQVLFDFLDRTGSVGTPIEAEFLPALSDQLTFQGVTLKEPGTGRKLLRGVTLAIEAGQRVALVGPDDMEKHALVYLLPRFLDPNSGAIGIDGKNLREVTLDSLRAQTGMVMQHNLVFNDTVANNIGCDDPAYNLAKIIEAAKIAHAHQFIQKLPQGYETPIGEMGHYLNSGEVFRIGLARAILRDPAILVIEEPLVPMDDDTKALIDDTYSRFLPGRTVLFLPHRLSTIRNCDRVFLLYQGKIEGAGDHRDLIKESDLYKHLQYLEFNEFAGLLAGPAPAQVEGEL